MWVYVFGIPALLLLYVIYRLSRPIGGGKTLEQWEKAGELSKVPRYELGDDAVAFVANGWYCIMDDNELLDNHKDEESAREVSALGREFRVWKADGEVYVRTNVGTFFLVDQSHGLILVWYHAEGAGPLYRVRDGKEPIPSGFELHGKTQHYVRSLLQDIPENGSDYAHFKVVHEDGEKAFGLIGRLLRLRLLFNGVWDISDSIPAMAIAKVENCAEIFGMPLEFTRQVVNVNQIGPSIVIEDSPQGVLGDRIILVQSVTPLGPFTHLEQTRAYSAPGFKARAGVHIFMQGFKGNLEEDIKMQCNKKYLAKPMLVKGDGPIAKFRRWFGTLYSEHSPRTIEQFYRDE